MTSSALATSESHLLRLSPPLSVPSHSDLPASHSGCHTWLHWLFPFLQTLPPDLMANTPLHPVFVLFMFSQYDLFNFKIGSLLQTITPRNPEFLYSIFSFFLSYPFKKHCIIYLFVIFILYYLFPTPQNASSRRTGIFELFTLMYLKCLKLCLSYCRCSINSCGMNEDRTEFSGNKEVEKMPS